MDGIRMVLVYYWYISNINGKDIKDDIGFLFQRISPIIYIL